MTAKVIFFFIVGLLLLLPATSAQTIFVVRHAERTGEPDPPLNDQGKRRADVLARLLSDANVCNFYTSDTVRARQTAEPTAALAHRSIEVVTQDAFDELITKVRSTLDAKCATLVVGHRETVPRIVQALSGSRIPPLRVDEHDRLVVITMMPSGKANIVSLRFGN